LQMVSTRKDVGASNPLFQNLFVVLIYLTPLL